MLQQTLRTKVHLLQAPRITIRTFRSSTRKLPLTALIAKTLTTLGRNTDFDVIANRIDKLERDVSALKGDVSSLKADIKELGPRIERSVEVQLAGHALNQVEQSSRLIYRSICGVSLTLYIIYQLLTRLRFWVLQCC